MDAFQTSAFAKAFEENGMAVTVYDPDSVVSVVIGNPPIDQTAEIVGLQAQIATLTTANAALQAKITAAQQALA